MSFAPSTTVVSWRVHRLTWMRFSRFEAFDEPWQAQFNTPGKAWEDKWGLMDSARNLKPGIKIPDCGGKGI